MTRAFFSAIVSELMRKEVLIAIVLGFGLGLLITFGLWSANKAMKQKEELPPTAEETTPSLSPTPIPASFSLAILTPEDESVQAEEKITVSGSTEPEVQVIIISNKDEEIVEADNTGKFSADITLEKGTNEITITATNEAGDEVTKTIGVVYSTIEF